LEKLSQAPFSFPSDLGLLPRLQGTSCEGSLKQGLP
jgi:hypothetical protein